ncbi:hypothetical protein OH77DRAFT_469546 [Trametes cingulata]|nr:hypothetical protein OH77DRAFT_469546 [Trametes cingulata]
MLQPGGDATETRNDLQPCLRRGCIHTHWVGSPVSLASLYMTTYPICSSRSISFAGGIAVPIIVRSETGVERIDVSRRYTCYIPCDKQRLPHVSCRSVSTFQRKQHTVLQPSSRGNMDARGTRRTNVAVRRAKS